MNKQIYKNNLSITYRDSNQSNKNVIVLIHGFLETSETWKDFSIGLSKNYRVISVDLPGHGNSDLYDAPFTMCKYAESVKHVLDAEKIKKSFIVGHSMGGYVAMAFADNHAEYLSGLCLLHSIPFADNDDKIEKRNETVLKIKMGNKSKLIKTHVKAVYANVNVQKFKKEIQTGKNIAKGIADNGIIASVIAMKDRKDRSNVLRDLNVPFLYICGMFDNFIPLLTKDFISMPNIFELAVLNDSGHMGMIEEKEKSLKIINDFIIKFIV